jgi:PIN domain nuclease of toxin-antitoxin system
MAFVLDTHALLWWLAEPERLSPAVYATLSDPGQPVFISAASAWEIATKRFKPVGRLKQQGFQPLPHRDPFDRLLAAQAEVEQLILLTLDPALAPFPCQTLC